MNSKGDVVPVLVPPAGVELYSPTIHRPAPPVIGTTRLFDWLMVDVRVAKNVTVGSRLYEICQGLSERGACGVIESTLIIDLLEMKSEDRRFLLTKDNWTEATARAVNDHP